MSDYFEDINALREKNIAERDAFLATLMNDPLFDDLAETFKSKPPTPKPKKRIFKDSSFKFTGQIPIQQRKSSRLQNKNPEYTYKDLPSDKVLRHPLNENVDDLEEVVYRVKPKKKPSVPLVPAKSIPVEEVTETMIANIQTFGNKVYGADGSSCHQCRQKTMDTKTSCRSGHCIGVRGQFCGICVINRYGEDPVKALKDPNWKCYVCRGCCNCSFCRTKQGKRPTGILAPLAKSNGYKSVKDFLESLNGYGDYETDPENLLGFDEGHSIMTGKKRLEIKSTYDVEEFLRFAKL